MFNCRINKNPSFRPGATLVVVRRNDEILKLIEVPSGHMPREAKYFFPRQYSPKPPPMR